MYCRRICFFRGWCDNDHQYVLQFRKRFCHVAEADSRTGANNTLDFVSATAVIISGILIFTVIQAQDFPDVEGDKAVGRMTFPIYAPELSRFLTFLAIIIWSIFLSWFWGVGRVSTTLFLNSGVHVGLRYYLCRTLEADRKSYLIFNVRLPFPDVRLRDADADWPSLGLAHGSSCTAFAR